MPVEQPVLDTNYKHLKNDTNLAKNDDDKNDCNYSNHSSDRLREELCSFMDSVSSERTSKLMSGMEQSYN